MRKKRAAGLLIFGILLFTMAANILGCGLRSSGTSPMKCTLLRVGKADAIVLEAEGHTILIDAGEEEDGEEVLEFLKEEGTRQIDLMIITHYDKDHVGGADTIIEKIPVLRVLIPDYEGGSTEYSDFLKAMKEAEIEPERIREPVSAAFGKMQLKVAPPDSYEIPEGSLEYDNNFSLLTTVTYGSNNFFFTGDIEKERIRQISQAGEIPACDFLKVPHHGIYNTALEELIRIAHPKYAAICSSDKHPAEQMTLELLKKYGADVLESRHGDIVVFSDGEKIEIRQRMGQ